MAAATLDIESIYQQEIGIAVTAANRGYHPDPPPSYEEIQRIPLSQIRCIDPPPSYDEATDENTDPPSYESLFSRVREVNKRSDDFLDFLKKLLILLFGSLGFAIIIGFNFAIPITMCLIGAIYIHICPVQPILPSYLIIGGVFGTIKSSMIHAAECRKGEEEAASSLRKNPLFLLVNAVMCIWFITGGVLYYQLYELRDQLKMPGYCSRTPYMFTFWLLTAIYIYFALSCIYHCCFKGHRRAVP